MISSVSLEEGTTVDNFNSIIMKEKEEFLQRFNQAFLQNDVNYIIDCTTDDVLWIMVGDKTIRGKKDLAEAMNQIKASSSLDLKIDSMIIEGDKAAVDGTMSMDDKDGNRKSYGFCDLYKLTSDGDLKIKELRSYVVDVSKNMHDRKA